MKLTNLDQMDISTASESGEEEAHRRNVYIVTSLAHSFLKEVDAEALNEPIFKLLTSQRLRSST